MWKNTNAIFVLNENGINVIAKTEILPGFNLNCVSEGMNKNVSRETFLKKMF